MVDCKFKIGGYDEQLMSGLENFLDDEKLINPYARFLGLEYGVEDVVDFMRLSEQSRKDLLDNAFQKVYYNQIEEAKKKKFVFERFWKNHSIEINNKLNKIYGNVLNSDIDLKIKINIVRPTTYILKSDELPILYKLTKQAFLEEVIYYFIIKLNYQMIEKLISSDANTKYDSLNILISQITANILLMYGDFKQYRVKFPKNLFLRDLMIGGEYAFIKAGELFKNNNFENYIEKLWTSIILDKEHLIKFMGDFYSKDYSKNYHYFYYI